MQLSIKNLILLNNFFVIQNFYIKANKLANEKKQKIGRHEIMEKKKLPRGIFEKEHDRDQPLNLSPLKTSSLLQFLQKLTVINGTSVPVYELELQTVNLEIAD